MRYRVRELREKRRYTQTELAEMSGVSRATINKLESGERMETTTAVLQKIADALEVSVRSLFLPN